MSDYPIVFSAPMIRALLDSRKSMTRRLAWRFNKKNGVIYETPWQRVTAGDRIWVRENWKPHSLYAGMKPRNIPRSKVFYASDEKYAPSNAPWVPCIYMPRWASRLTLVVTATKIERLQDISEDDAKAEGIRYLRDCCYGTDNPDGTTGTSPQAAFAALWESLHGVGSVAANPEVVAISFVVHCDNIDHMKVEAA